MRWAHRCQGINRNVTRHYAGQVVLRSRTPAASIASTTWPCGKAVAVVKIFKMPVEPQVLEKI